MSRFLAELRFPVIRLSKLAIFPSKLAVSLTYRAKDLP